MTTPLFVMCRGASACLHGCWGPEQGQSGRGLGWAAGETWAKRKCHMRALVALLATCLPSTVAGPFPRSMQDILGDRKDGLVCFKARRSFKRAECRCSCTLPLAKGSTIRPKRSCRGVPALALATA